MKNPPPDQLVEMLRCARRELGFRRHVYPGLVRKGRMDQGTADRELKAQALIVQFLEQQQGGVLPGIEG